MKNAISRYVLAFFLSVFAAVALLLLAASLPQKPIDQNVLESVDLLLGEGEYHSMGGAERTAWLDNYTDALILSESKGTSIDQPRSIFSNPMYMCGFGDGPVEDLWYYAYSKEPVARGTYSRYWMGFRAPMRLALSFLNYYQIRRVLSVLFFGLFTAVVCSLMKHINQKTAMLFALSIISVRPQVICICLQYSCCFLIAFLAMLAVPRLVRRPEYWGLFFMELGIATMYFDFYTTPIITLGLPLVYLYLLSRKEGSPIRGKKVVQYTLNWFLGYIGMWISKLILTTVFTKENAFLTAWKSVSVRLGIQEDRGADARYNPIQALEHIWEAVTSDGAGEKIAWMIIGAVLVVIVVLSFRKKLRLSDFTRHMPLLFVAALPIIWFMVAAQPIAIHSFFQYRSVVMIYWSLAAYVLLTFVDEEKNLCT